MAGEFLYRIGFEQGVRVGKNQYLPPGVLHGTIEAVHLATMGLGFQKGKSRIMEGLHDVVGAVG